MMMGFGLIWVVLILIGAAVLLRNGSGLGSLLGLSSRDHSIDHTEADAGEILAQRYARGEITRDQYQTMKKDLEG